jgi:hypothetical protein
MMNFFEPRPDLLALLAEDHQVVTVMIQRLKTLTVAEERQALVAELEERWLAHADAEDELLLAPLAARPDSAALVADVRACHAAIERALDHLGSLDAADPVWAERLGLLERLIAEHVTSAEQRLFEHARPALDPGVRRKLAASYHAALRDLAA